MLANRGFKDIFWHIAEGNSTKFQFSSYEWRGCTREWERAVGKQVTAAATTQRQCLPARKRVGREEAIWSEQSSQTVCGCIQLQLWVGLADRTRHCHYSDTRQPASELPGAKPGRPKRDRTRDATTLTGHLPDGNMLQMGFPKGEAWKCAGSAGTCS